MQEVTTVLTGLPPGLLMHSKRGMDEDPNAGKKSRKHRPPEEEAELGCYWTNGKKKKKTLAIPWVAVYSACIEASKQYKFKGQKTFADIIAATVSCDCDFIPLTTDKYEVYEEWVRIPPKTGGVVKIARPRIRKWTTEPFVIYVDDEVYQLDEFQKIFIDAGKLVGICAWRPQKRGPYGKFAVEKFEA